VDVGRASERAFRQRRILLGQLVAFGADADKLPRQQFRLALLRRQRHARLDCVLASPFKLCRDRFSAYVGLGQPVR
jgi:hypothetical protein